MMLNDLIVASISGRMINTLSFTMFASKENDVDCESIILHRLYKKELRVIVVEV